MLSELLTSGHFLTDHACHIYSTASPSWVTSTSASFASHVPAVPRPGPGESTVSATCVHRSATPRLAHVAPCTHFWMAAPASVGLQPPPLSEGPSQNTARVCQPFLVCQRPCPSAWPQRASGVWSHAALHPNPAPCLLSLSLSFPDCELAKLARCHQAGIPQTGSTLSARARVLGVLAAVLCSALALTPMGLDLLLPL